MYISVHMYVATCKTTVNCRYLKGDIISLRFVQALHLLEPIR